jgi:hypothetical protein
VAEKSAAERNFELVEAELNGERAAVLGRYGRRVERAFATCAERRAELDVNDESSVAAYRSARRRALQAIADLCFQREMIGLTEHSRVYETYPVPPDP